MSDFTPKYFRIVDTDEETPEDTFIKEAFKEPELDYDTQEATELPSKPVIEDGQAMIDGEALPFEPITETVVIDGTVYEGLSVSSYDFHGVKEAGNFYLAEDEDQAGTAARQNWEDMAKHDPSEFACMVGEETLVQWGMGQSAGPGTSKVNSLSEWLDLFLTDYASELARYDGEERTVDFCSEDMIEELGYTPTLAFRNN